MNLPKQLTTVTTLSKLISGVLFVTLPFVGFWVGIQYQQYLTQVEYSENPHNDNTTNLAPVDFVDFDANLRACIASANSENPAKEKQLIIRSNEEYSSNIGLRLCSKLPDVDFSQYTLLGKYTESGGCSVNTKREVFKDEENAEIIYKITLQAVGHCKMLSTSMNWILVPKIDKSYTVKFKVDNIEAADQMEQPATIALTYEGNLYNGTPESSCEGPKNGIIQPCVDFAPPSEIIEIQKGDNFQFILNNDLFNYKNKTWIVRPLEVAFINAKTGEKISTVTKTPLGIVSLTADVPEGEYRMRITLNFKDSTKRNYLFSIIAHDRLGLGADKSNWEKAIDLATCRVGDKRYTNYPHIYDSISVKSDEQDHCILEYKKHDGYYNTYECRYLKSLNILLPKDIKVSDCELTESISIYN